MPIKRIEQRVVFENRWLQVYDDLIEHPDGTAGSYSWVERNGGRGGAIAIPRLSDGRLLLVKMHRYVPDRWSWEFPGGGIDEGETPEQCALRELSEETGIDGGSANTVGSFSSDSGFIAVRHTAVLVTLPEDTEEHLKLDRQESIAEARFVTEQEAWAMVASGEIFDGTIITALGLLRATPGVIKSTAPAGLHPKRVRAKLVYDSPWWRLYEDDIVRPDGSEGIYVRVHTAMGGGAIIVIPRTPSGKHLLIKIHRYPVDEELWEFPAGLVERGEDPVDTAIRELEEETGLKATNAELTGTQFPVAGLLSDTFYTVLATVPEPDDADLKLQAEEGIIDAQWVTLEDLRRMVDSNEVRDGVTLGAIARLLAADA